MNLKKQKAMERLNEEYKELKLCESKFGISFGLEYFDNDEPNVFEWKLAIYGPKNTSYYQGLFSAKIIFPENYPEEPPDIYFKNPIYHPNINPVKVSMNGAGSLGHLYLNILNDWKPETKMKDVFEHIYNLFFSVDLNSPYIFDKEEEFKYNRPVYEEKIKCFTKKYADPHKADLKYDTDWDFSSPEILV